MNRDERIEELWDWVLRFFVGLYGFLSWNRDFEGYTWPLNTWTHLALSQSNDKVRLLSLEGRATPQGNQLSWKVADPAEAIRMELERSGDARNFVTIYS